MKVAPQAAALTAGLLRNTRGRLLAVLTPMSLVLSATAACSQEPEQTKAQVQPRSQAQAQGRTQVQAPWRGLNVPRYANGTGFQIETDEDEYEIYFRSHDDVRAIFEFYRGYLQQQGFRVTRSQNKEHGFKVDMVRGRGGPNDTVELDVKSKDGRIKVEIEFDE